MTTATLLASLLASTPAVGPTAAAPAAPDPLAGLRFLLGAWKATSGGGAPGEAIAGGFTFVLDLDGRVAVRRSFAEYATRPGDTKGHRHEDLAVVWAGPDGLRAIYWDGEGHEIEYAVATAPGRATFESAGPGPRFRLDYREVSPGEVTISFSVAPPGADFREYVSGTARRTDP